MNGETKTESNYLRKYILLEHNFWTQRYLEHLLTYTQNFNGNI